MIEERLGQEILKIILERDNKKINTEETLDEYLKTFTNEKLTRFALVSIYSNPKLTDLIKIRNINNKPKRYIINYIKENINDVIGIYPKVINKNHFNQLKKIIKNNGNLKFYLKDGFKINLHFIQFLKDTPLGKVYYNKNEDSIQIHIPKEFNDILNYIINNKEVIKENKKYNEIYNFTESVLDVYGILTLEELHYLYTKNIKNIEHDELNKVLNTYIMVNDGFFVYSYDGVTLIANIEFSDLDKTFDFYEEYTGEINKKLTKKDIASIRDYTYLRRLKSYKKLIDYLDTMYEGIKEEHQYLDEFIIIDYLYSAQISIERADSNFRNNIINVLEGIDIIQINILSNMMKEIYNEYPKWKKRGNI